MLKLHMDNSRLYQELRVQLEHELVEINGLRDASEAARAPVSLDQQSVGRLSRMDAMQGQAMAQAAERRRQQRAGMISAALERLDEGEFGFCLGCGEPTPEGRLKADPTVTRCVGCASA
ncbi:MAG: TraR/DksA C4-type zinc finger protein [Parvibaculum sp.]|nr:TraR/DksA C4-type zinc finger protein [Parvibaculum sp.]